MSTESIIASATQLHEALAVDRNEQSPEIIKETIISRRRLVTEIRTQLRELRKMKKAIEIDAARRMAEVQEEMDALIGLVSIQDDDIREMEDVKWDRIRGQKEVGKPHGTSPEFQ